MGNSSNKHNSETIKWKLGAVKGDTIKLDSDIRNLVSNLRMDNNESEFNEDVLQSVLNKHLKKTNNNEQNFADSDMSTASPFITADIYNYLQDKALKGHTVSNNHTSLNNIDMDLQFHQAGGANKKQMKDLLDDSSTSMTSSTGDLSSTDDSSDSEKTHRKKKHHKKDHHRSLKSRKETESDNLSYLSSSAHTGGEFTETNKSVSNENQHMGQDSIHTSDINMVSEY